MQYLSVGSFVIIQRDYFRHHFLTFVFDEIFPWPMKILGVTKNLDQGTSPIYVLDDVLSTFHAQYTFREKKSECQTTM